MHLAQLAAATALTGFLFVPANTAAPAPAVDDVFPTPSGALTVPGLGLKADAEYTIADLLQDFAAVSGQSIVMNSETRNLVGNTNIILDADVTVPPERVYPYVEALLMAHDFTFFVLSEETPRTLMVVSLQQAQARSTIKQRARYVPVDEIERYADHAALLVTTTLEMEFVDVRQLITSLRPMMPDQSTQSMLNAGSTNSLVLTGFGPVIVDLVHMLRRIDADASPYTDLEEENR